MVRVHRRIGGLAALALASFGLFAPRAALAEAEPAAKASLAVVERQLAAELGPNLALESVRPHRPLPAEVVDVMVSFRTAPHAGVQTISLVVVDARGQRLETWAELRATPVRRALVAKRALAVGATIGAGDVATERVVGGAARLLEIDPSELEGARVLTAIAAGAPLVAGAVELPPPLARGTPLRVIIQVGAVQVATEGTLERAARAGEPAAARLARTARIVHGRLADRETLVVEGGRP